MMKVIRYPERAEWTSLLERPHIDMTALYATVNTVLADVRTRGDQAVLDYEEKFDRVRLSSLQVTEAEMEAAEQLIPEELKDALQQAERNIATFLEAQRFQGKKIETAPGVVCWQKAVPIEKVGLYIPGGCREIVLCTPPDREGRVNPAILHAARLAGVHRIFKAGGVQAIGAMAYGTETVPKVYKIFGPGNQYVMAAKQQVSLHEVAIDMPAGPSEVLVVADEKANPVFVAADLLSQAEHGADSQVLLVTTSDRMLERVREEVQVQLEQLPRRELAVRSLEHSKLILVRSMEEAMELANAYAPEHLILEVEDYASLAEKVVNAGSVFMGAYTPESAGDYASGTNHTLPTSGYARAYSGVNLDSFVRKITFQELSPEGIRNIGPAIE